jgi:hypothetical protein
MLVTFSVSFTLFCHCAAMAAAVAKPAHCQHCHKKASNKMDDTGCQGMQAVKFNLLEKQTANAIHPAPTPLTALIAWNEFPLPIAFPQKRTQPQQWSYKHSPPDLLSLYQCFLI